jgi:hypothetical protein
MLFVAGSSDVAGVMGFKLNPLVQTVKSALPVAPHYRLVKSSHVTDSPWGANGYGPLVCSFR